MSCNHCQCHCHNEDTHNHSHEHSHEEENHNLMFIRLILGSLLLFGGLFTKLNAVFVIAYLILGYDVVINAFRNIKHIFNEHFLMTIATVGAFIIGEFPEAVAVMLFYQLGELLSDIAVDKSKDSIGKLIDLRCDTANVLKDGVFSAVASEEVKIKDIIRVSAGEKIPLDGIIKEGTAYLDTKSLTGESVPKKVSVGDTVLSGMICNDSVLLIEVTKVYEDSTASKILELINDEKKSNSEKFISKFARIYTPIVVVLAVLIAILPLLFGGEFKVWFYRAMLFLVVSCPCALVVSVPLSFFSGVGCASKKGILVKGAFSLEEASGIKTVAFDKTGTLTEGSFAVQSVRSTKYPKAELLKYAAYCEFFSSHPIAKAIVSAYPEEIDEKRISDYREIAGKGICATIDSHKIEVGSATFIKDSVPAENSVFVAIDGEYAGSIEICDKIKEASYSLSSELTNLGVKSVILTGDSNDNAKSVSNLLKMEYFSELLPQDKVAKLKELKNEGKVAFIGDGINDAPALSIANIGISMGEIGSDAAIEASDAVIMSDNPKKILTLIKISRKTMGIVRENIAFAIGVKLIIMLLGAVGVASMWLAVFADVGVCLIAVLNSLRAFFVKD